MGAKRRLARRMLNFITGARSPPKTLWRPRRRDARGVVADRFASTESGDGGHSRVARKGGATQAAQANELLIDWLKFR